MKLQPKYQFLAQQPLPPKMVMAALQELGTVETKGGANSPKILGWADEVAKICPSPYNNWAADWYNADSIPWCGLFMAVITARCSDKRPDRFPPAKYLSALSWVNWGTPVNFKPKGKFDGSRIFVGDVAVFVRQGGGHVALIVGVSQNGQTIHVLGGNQGDAVTITEISVERLYAVRRPTYLVQPAGARHVVLNSSGLVSDNEA